jgi:MFS family permease
VIPVVTTIFGAAYAVQPGYGIGFEKDVYLWIPVMGNIVAVIVIPFVGNLADKVGRRLPIIVGALGAGLLSFGYLYAISIHNVPLAIGMSLLMWGVVYQGYNAVFPSFYPEMFPTPGFRGWPSRRTSALSSPRCCRRSSSPSRRPARPTSR